MATSISRDLPQFAPATHLYRLADGRHVIVTVPDDDMPLHEAVVPILSAFTVTETVPGPTEVFLCDEDAHLIDADGDPTNGMTALATYPTGTTHQQALDLLEASDGR